MIFQALSRVYHKDMRQTKINNSTQYHRALEAGHNQYASPRYRASERRDRHYRGNALQPSTPKGQKTRSRHLHGARRYTPYLEPIVKRNRRKILHIVKRHVELLEAQQGTDAIQVADPARRKPQHAEVCERAAQVPERRKSAPPLQTKLGEKRHQGAQVIHLLLRVESIVFQWRREQGSLALEV